MPAWPASATQDPNRSWLSDRSHHGSAQPSRTSIGYSGGRDRTCASRLTVACLTARPHRNEEAEAAGFEPAERQAALRGSSALPFHSAMPPLRRKEGSRTPKAGAHPFSRRDTAPDGSPSRKVTPAGLEPARRRLRVGRSTELSYGARDVVGRNRTCNAPRFKRALYLIGATTTRVGEAGIEPATSCL